MQLRETGRWEMVTMNSGYLHSNGVSGITVFATKEEATNAAEKFNAKYADDPTSSAFVRPEYVTC